MIYALAVQAKSTKIVVAEKHKVLNIKRFKIEN